MPLRPQPFPLWIGVDADLPATPMTQRLDKDAFDEKFVQKLLFEHPGCVPFHEIEPGLLPFHSVCREMPTRHGPVDNVFITARGDVAIAEAKLWRNPEARRQVIAQTLDYASCIFSWSYEQFEHNALKGQFGKLPRPKSLYSMVANAADALSEEDFVDAVGRNLTRGRIIILVVGDGIRHEVAHLATELQSHAGFHFTFALVEMGVYDVPAPGRGRVVVPRVLTQTQLIERGIVRIEGSLAGVSVVAPNPQPSPSGMPTANSLGSISAEQFYEALAQHHSAAPDAVKRLLTEMGRFDVYGDVIRGLNLKWEGRLRTYNLGLIQRDGVIWLDTMGGGEPRDLARKYVEGLAAAWGGKAVEDKRGFWTVKIGDRAPKVAAVLSKLDAWPAIAEAYVTGVREYEDRISDASRS